MARKSRKKAQNIFPVMPAISAPKSKTGIYARLSVEDNGNAERDSIQNQVSYLEEYVKRNEDDFQLVHIYVDNGTTGTNFDRAGWKELIEDVKTGAVDCLVFKDFSRIGRDYIEVGNYLEKIFPFLGVRVISVNDNFDSRKQPFENNMLMNSLTNIVNDYYAKDISRKILQAKKVMQENGEYTSGIYPYGYKGDDSNKRSLAVDPEAADVVKKIFKWRIQGKGCTRIANYLNELAIPSPGLYRFMNGFQSFKRSSHSKWRAEHISGILTNPVYLGHLVQGKSQGSHFRNNGKKQRLPKEEWIISENTHIPLITQTEFDIAEAMAEKSHKMYCERMNANTNIPQEENCLREKIYCRKCGQKMFRRSRVTNGVRRYYFYCDSKRRFLDTECVQASIYETPLMETVNEVIHQQMQLYGILSNQWAGQEKNMTGSVHGIEVDKQKRDIHKQDLMQKIQSIKRKRRELYVDMKEGLLAQEDFEYEKKQLAQKQLSYEIEIKNAGGKNKEEEKAIETLNVCLEESIQAEDRKIPLEILDTLIEKIIVESPERIEIKCTYADLLQKWCNEMQLSDWREGGIHG